MHKMSRKYRSRIADTEIDLALREILHEKQTGPSQIGVRQEGHEDRHNRELCNLSSRRRDLLHRDARGRGQLQRDRQPQDWLSTEWQTVKQRHASKWSGYFSPLR